MPTKIDFTKTKFIKSASDGAQFLIDHPCIAFLGRSNVGKSTLINSLVSQRNLMKTSKTPGLTRQINYALVDEKFYLVDLPGYGYASYERDYFDKLMDDFFSQENVLKKVYLLIDSRRLLLPADEDFMSYLSSKGLNYSVVFTKTDKLNKSDRHYLSLQKEKLSDVEFFETNQKDKQSLEVLRKDIIKTVLSI